MSSRQKPNKEEHLEEELFLQAIADVELNLKGIDEKKELDSKPHSKGKTKTKRKQKEKAAQGFNFYKRRLYILYIFYFVISNL